MQAQLERELWHLEKDKLAAQAIERECDAGQAATERRDRYDAEDQNRAQQLQLQEEQIEI